MTSPGFRRVPNWLFFRQIQERRKRREPFTPMEAWCSLDYDLFRHGKLESERAYAANWRRNRAWVRRHMRWFREERGLATPPPGRRPSPKPRPRSNGGFVTAADYRQAIAETKS